MSFDIAKLDISTPSNKGETMTLRYPNGDTVRDDAGNPITFTLLGRFSDKVRAVERRLGAARMEQAKRGMRQLSQDDVEREMTDRLMVTITGWSFTHLDGQEFPFTEANARKLLSDPRFAMIRSQISNFVDDDGNFMKG